MRFRTEIGELLFELSNRPQDFVIKPNNLVLVHKPTGVEIWIQLSPELYAPVRASFNWLDRRRVKRIVRVWQEAERRRRLAAMFDVDTLLNARQLQEASGKG
jgi:hypothetical protein